MKDDLYLSKKGEVFAFDFIQKYEEMFAREDALAKKREAKEKEENERNARERREKQKNMSEEERKTKEAIFNIDHLVSWKHEGDPNVTPLLETELADGGQALQISRNRVQNADSKHFDKRQTTKKSK